MIVDICRFITTFDISDVFFDGLNESHIMSVIWLTGLSGSGKSTIAEQLATHLDSHIVDGDVIRRNISSDLKHGETDRQEHYRRVVNYIKSNLARSQFTIVAMVSPNKIQREWIKTMFHKDSVNFYEIYVKSYLQTSEMRDPKGLFTLDIEKVKT